MEDFPKHHLLMHPETSQAPRPSRRLQGLDLMLQQNPAVVRLTQRGGLAATVLQGSGKNGCNTNVTQDGASIWYTKYIFF